MVDINDKTLCSGCGACSNICPKKCISMIRDEEGFRYPKIDYDRCIKCGLCSKICPVINNKTNNKQPLAVYGAINKDINILKKSSSGGVFTEIAKYILNNNGIVFGVIYDENINAVHSYIEKEEDLIKMQGSKYVESDTNISFELAKKFLKQGKLVLFSGTPCQIGGLNAYLKQDYENLITCDFICLGVPTPRIFDAYKNHFERINNYKITNVEFRNKKNGWVHFNMTFHFENGQKKYILRYNNPYMYLHYGQLSVRPSCYECRFRGLNSNSDIKLADFWRVREANSPMYDFYGVSHVFLNSEKGLNIFEKIKDNFKVSESSYDEALKLNKSLSSIKVDPEKRKLLFEDIDKLSDEELILRIKSLFNQTFMDKLKSSIRVKLSKIKYSLKK